MKTLHIYKDSLSALVGKKVLVSFRCEKITIFILGKLINDLLLNDYFEIYRVVNKENQVSFCGKDVIDIYKTNKNITIIL